VKALATVAAGLFFSACSGTPASTEFGVVKVEVKSDAGTVSDTVRTTDTVSRDTPAGANTLHLAAKGGTVTVQLLRPGMPAYPDLRCVYEARKNELDFTGLSASLSVQVTTNDARCDVSDGGT